MQIIKKRPIVYVISDSVGETAELVVKAAASQFNHSNIDIRRIPYVEDEETIEEVVTLAQEVNAIIAFTLVIPEKKQYLLELAEKAKVTTVDIMGPMINKLQDLTKKEPRYEPGLVHKLDEDYFRKVEAIEFAVKYDDGRDPRGIMRADVVLVGVSRTSKTPLSQYLAHKRLKVANVPLVPEVEPPSELFSISPKKCIGLTISPEKLNDIRAERLKALGLKAEANYANMERIRTELEYAEGIMNKIGCPVINVSNKAVEETANLIWNMFNGK
ncbi:phosphoenolpyruvate synthase regulatory protein [Anaerobacillus alkalilacustris]|uniref:Putative pyruvate, phosphate dikinase regulatory protein n=1 Tax=Anaerobacillus alkalilacustris TaxID=393763 RepID=A0A1S2LZ31_9BACI|nr:pyruvate, water dikinase regulatory protein [Anaerobacillus alkalilacustris]OIJ16705.1 phosphoenolpyruvate synthase regulatory protein [Anaerobacillus alkalilacustris]